MSTTEINPVVDKRVRALSQIEASNFPFKRNLIHAFIGGSELHGAKLRETDDLDIYGVYIEPPTFALGLHRHEHFVTSTSGNERRNGPDDVDITLYSLRYWSVMAAKGNPTALHFLFAHSVAEKESWREIAAHRDSFISKSSSRHFIGFVDSQLRRMSGERGTGKHGQRDELIIQHGYDTKAAMHATRLMYECMELMRDRTITFPRPECEELIAIRKGEWSKDRLIRHIYRLIAEAQSSVEKSALPERVGLVELSELISASYLAYWAHISAGEPVVSRGGPLPAPKSVRKS